MNTCWTELAAREIDRQLKLFAKRHHNIDAFHPGTIPIENIILRYLRESLPTTHDGTWEIYKD